MSAHVSVMLLLPKSLPSTANLREHWAVKAKRVKAQRQATRLALLGRAVTGLCAAVRADRSARLRCVLTRVAPRQLDSDNLASAFKAIRDEVAAVMGIDDGSRRWLWGYRQTVGQPAALIELSLAPPDAAVEMHARHTDECLEALTDPGATCVGGPPAVADPLVGKPLVVDGHPVRMRCALVPTPNVRRPR